ncbi:MAG: DUF202 domain-containing protein [Phycisphaerales bacterium]|nr:DUF202 domain-containing protein [Phycisphaerales bacterium]
MFARAWHDLLGRITGPLDFRVIIQPIVAIVLATRAGLRDAREGRPPFLWTVLSNPAHRRDVPRNGWKDVATLFIVSAILDVIYQVDVLKAVYAGELLIVATLLAPVPYCLLRGPVTRIARWAGLKPTAVSGHVAVTREQVKEPAAPLDEAQLAAERTYLSHERTLMAWVRTGASLITFGFGFYKFFEFMYQEEPGRPVSHLLGPRTYGLIFIFMGVGFLGVATLQQRRSMKRLRAQQFAAPFSLALLLAAMMTGLGILALITAFFRA